jgi:flagellar biosynthetic protein FliR
MRLFLAAALAALLAPLGLPAGPVAAGWAGHAAACAREGLIGLIMGAALQLPFAAVQAAGNVVDAQLGMSMVSLLDPEYGEQRTLLSTLMSMVAVWIFLSLDGHLWVIKGLAESFRALPVAAGGLPRAEGLRIALDASSIIRKMAIQLAAPVVAALLAAEAAMAFASRAIPQMNIMALGLPLRMGVGLAAFAAAFPVAAYFIARVFHDFLPVWGSVVTSL